MKPVQQIYWISSPAQMKAIESPMRQEVVDAIAALGPSTIAEVGEHLGRAADSLYFHVRKLEKVGLLVEQEKRKEGKYVVAVYGLAGKMMRLKYGGGAVAKSVQRVVAGAVRLSLRDFNRALDEGGYEYVGPGRTVWGARTKGWVSKQDIAEVNRLLEELSAIFSGSAQEEGKTLQSLAWILAPVGVKGRAKKRAEARVESENGI